MVDCGAIYCKKLHFTCKNWLFSYNLSSSPRKLKSTQEVLTEASWDDPDDCTSVILQVMWQASYCTGVISIKKLQVYCTCWPLICTNSSKFLKFTKSSCFKPPTCTVQLKFHCKYKLEACKGNRPFATMSNLILIFGTL